MPLFRLLRFIVVVGRQLAKVNVPLNTGLKCKVRIHYLDYATHSDIILCSRPICTHDDESCSSFIQSNSLVPSLAVVGDRLRIVGGGIGVSDPEEGDLPYIEVMQLDGNDRKRVYTPR